MTKEQEQVLEDVRQMLKGVRAEKGVCPSQEEATLVSTREEAKYCGSSYAKCSHMGDKKGFIGKDRSGHVTIDYNHLCGYEGNSPSTDSQPQEHQDS